MPENQALPGESRRRTIRMRFLPEIPKTWWKPQSHTCTRFRRADLSEEGSARPVVSFRSVGL